VADEAEQRDLVGQIVDGRFQVEATLGSGGMGTVWRVQHVVSLQRFALKTLDPKVATGEQATQRFLREAQTAAALRTRHVVRIVDAQMDHQHQGEPLPFLVMELLEGKNLQQILDERGRISPGELVWVAGQLGRALDAAHKQGIVHRDLKPSNVFIAEDADDDGKPLVKLCDFGIAKLTGDAALASDPALATRTGALLGTPMYLAPELLRGAAAAVPATDQWSMGLIAFRALAGAEYFAHVRGFSDLVLTIANDPLIPPSRRAAGMPRAFDAWFLRSCARRPEERFPDVPSQVTALGAALGHAAPVPVVVRPGSPGAIEAAPTDGARARQAPPTRAAAPRTRKRRVIYLGGALVWGVCAVAALAWLGRRERAEVHATTGQETTSAAPRVATQGVSPAAVPALLPDSGGAAAAEKMAPAPVVDDRADTPAVAPAPAPSRRRRHASAPRPAAKTVTAPPSPAALPLPKGAACRRSAECASGLCAAETCL
jgi:eukaryotic-like serine/threonine-protein kinase